jgi:hypothetical protein
LFLDIVVSFVHFGIQSNEPFRWPGVPTNFSLLGARGEGGGASEIVVHTTENCSSLVQSELLEDEGKVGREARRRKKVSTVIVVQPCDNNGWKFLGEINSM